MRALDLELAPRGNRAGITGYVLAAAAVAFAADTALHYSALRQEIALREARLAKRDLPSAVTAVDPDAYKAAAETVRRLAAPWDRLFEALEAAQTERVALVAIEPDVEGSTVLISGEAKDYLAALTYVARLSEQKALSRVHLVRHEARRAPQQAVGFTISASWKGAR